MQLKLIKNVFSREAKSKSECEKKTYRGVPTVRLFKSNEMLFGSSAPLQQVTIFAVDLVLLHFPTIIVTIGNACKWNVKTIEQSNEGKISEANTIKTISQLLAANIGISYLNKIYG